jgi:hypothetical protein
MPESRTGASTLSSGASAPMPTSNRTWSLPLPVQPCATVVAPWYRAPVHVEGVGLEGRQAVLVGELVPDVRDDRLDRATRERALADDVEVLAALADVARDGDHLGPGLLGDPADGNGGVQPT